MGKLATSLQKTLTYTFYKYNPLAKAVTYTKQRIIDIITVAFKMRLIGSLLVFSLVLSFVLGGSAQNCGSGVVYGGRDTGHGTHGGELGKIISREMFEDLLEYRNDKRCPGRCFYNYDAFIEAAKAFPAFGNSGNETVRKREIAAFFAQTGHETTGLFQFLISLIKFKDSFFRCANK